MCYVPPAHVQKECHDDIDCLLTEYVLTLQAEQAMEEAFKPCKWLIRGIAPLGSVK